MISVAGYTSVFQIVMSGTRNGSLSFSPDQVRKALETCDEFFAIKHDGVAVAVPKAVISTWHNEFFVFLDNVTWTISFEHLRNGASEIGEKFSISMGFFGLLGGIPHSPIPEIAKGLLPLEGTSLAVRSDKGAIVSSTLTSSIERTNPKVQKRQLRGDEAGRAFSDFLEQNPRVTAAERDAWSSSNLSGGRDAGRALWKKLKPDGGSRPGPKPK